MTFWIIIVALALVVAVSMIQVLMRKRPQSGDLEPEDYDVKVYRDQLRDVDRDLARGVIGEADAERVRVEVSRRILAADLQARKQQAGARQAPTPTRVLAVVLVLLVVAGSGGLYVILGAPGYGDLGLVQRIEMANQARETRPGQAQAEERLPPEMPLDIDPSYKALIEQLREKVAQQPDDLQGQVLLARHEARSGNFSAAHKAQARVIELMGDTVESRQYAEYGELLIVAAGGYVSPEAEGALRTALELDPRDGPSRYYWGLMLGQIGRPDLAFRVWEGTMRQGPDDAPWLEPIRGMIEEMAWRAGVKYTLPDRPAPPPLAGPSAGDVAAAGDMSAEDRQAMIRNMVDRLSDRLANEGGSAAEWARLITALGVLGDTDRARAILDEARGVFAGNDDALGEIDAAARNAGLDG